jgi:phage-related minor tail protein
MADENLGALRLDFSVEDQNFRRSMGSMTRAMKALDSEFDAVRTSSTGLDDQMSRLQSTSTLLSRKMDIQRAKVEELKRRYDESAKAKGNDSREAQNLLIQYNRNLTQLNRLEDRFNATNRAIEEQATGLGELRRTAEQNVGRMTDQVNLLNARFEAGIAGIGDFGKSTQDLRLKEQYLTETFELQEKSAKELQNVFEETIRVKGRDARETQDAEKAYLSAINTLRRTGRELEDVQGQIKDQSNSWNKLSDRLHSFSDRAGNIGSGLTTSLTAPLGALGLMAGNMANDFDKSQGAIQASLGLTKEEAKLLNKDVKALWKEGFGESLAEVEEALIQTKNNIKGIDNGSVKGITKDALVLSKIWKADVNEVTRAGNNIMKGFGKNSKEAFDLMTFGAQNGLNFSNELFDNLSEYGPLFGKMGFSAEDYFQLLIKGSEAGVYNLDYINDSFKEFQIRLKDGSKTTADAMGQLSSETQAVWKDFLNGKATVKDVSNAVLGELKGMDDQVKANNIGVGLFGTKWEDLEADAMYAMSNIDGKLGDVQGSTKKAADAISDNFGARATTTFRKIGERLEPLGDKLLVIADKYLPKVGDAVEGALDKFNSLPDGAQDLIITIGGIAAVAGPAALALAPVVSAIGSIGSFAATAAGAGGLGALTAGLGAVALPIAAVTGAVVGLTSAGVYMYQNWDSLTEKQNRWKLALFSAVPGLTAVVGGIKAYQWGMEDSIQTATKFGDNVSGSTQKAIGGFVKLRDEALSALSNTFINGEVITDEGAKNLIGKFNAMGEEIKNKLKTHFDEQYSDMQLFFQNSSSLTDDEEAKILGKIQETSSNKEAEIQKHQETESQKSGTKRKMKKEA